MSYTLSWYEKVEGEWKRFSREISEEEYQKAMSTKTIKGFKEGSIVQYVQLTTSSSNPYVPKETNKPKVNKPYYRKERW